MCSVGVGDEHRLTSLPLREGTTVLGLGKEREYLTLCSDKDTRSWPYQWVKVSRKWHLIWLSQRNSSGSTFRTRNLTFSQTKTPLISI